jgi:hypothetical protein
MSCGHLSVLRTGCRPPTLPLHVVTAGKMKGDFLDFLFYMYDIQHCLICRPSNSSVSEDAGIEPRTVATTALTTRLELIHLNEEITPLLLTGIGERYC